MGKHRYYTTWKYADAFKCTEIFGDIPLTTKRKIKTHKDIKCIKSFITKVVKEEKKITISNLIITNIIKL